LYLPHLKEEVDKIAKNPKVLIILCLLFILLASAGGWLLCQHYDNLDRSDRDNVRATIRNAQELNRDAQTELDRARAANQDAADANQNAQRAADDLADSAGKLSGLNQSDADAIDAAERVFNDVERANQ
jgi:uncharacterized phage infection (PIP) family protein YhgE